MFPIEVPPRYARASDIPLLVNRFVGKFSTKMGKKIDGVSQSTMDRLMTYAWPGNIRELEHVIERATILANGPLLQIDDVMLQGYSASPLPVADSLEEVERTHILRILQDTALAPGRRKAYAILDEPGNYEFWTLDLEGRRLERRTRFAGRPRMELAVSSDGALLYVFGAGNTIDIYEAATHRYLRTVSFDFEVFQLYVLSPGR